MNRAGDCARHSFSAAVRRHVVEVGRTVRSIAAEVRYSQLGDQGDRRGGRLDQARITIGLNVIVCADNESHVGKSVS